MVDALKIKLGFLMITEGYKSLMIEIVKPGDRVNGLLKIR